jgi:dTDP-4-amino-4,6-dideoxygalactose transaminase
MLNTLAIDGGLPVRTTPLPAWPVFDKDAIDAATRVLQSGQVNYWTGNESNSFEREFAQRFGGGNAVSLANGTLALELALRSIQVSPGDEVVVTPRSYFATASAIALLGARPVFADIDENSQNITAQSIGEKITERTRAVVVVHLAGWPCAMREIVDVARAHDLHVVEDCAQAHGASYEGQSVGSFGSVAAFSFCQDKIISTAGEGGMLLTQDPALWEFAWSFKDHGKSLDRVNAKNHPPGFRWLHDRIGSNYRLTEIQAAIGRLQLEKLNVWVDRRRANAKRLHDGLSDIGALRIPIPSSEEFHAYYKFYAFVRPERLRPGWTRDRILQALEAEGIPGLSGSCPEIYRERAFAHLHHEPLPVAAELGQTSIMLLVHPTLTDADIDDMIEAVRKVVTCASAD